MLIRSLGKLIAFLASWTAFGYISGFYFHENITYAHHKLSRFIRKDVGDTESEADVKRAMRHSPLNTLNLQDLLNQEQFSDSDGIVDTSAHRKIFSNTTADRKYFSVFFEGHSVYDPTIIPHPTKHDFWLIVSPEAHILDPAQTTNNALICNGGFLGATMLCETIDPLDAQLHKPQCKDELAYLNEGLGPRAPKVFYGPAAPYVLYQAHAEHTCLGMYLQDVRMLIDEFYLQTPLVDEFREPTALMRPTPSEGFDKNFFIFWDDKNQPYVHHEIYPQRVFAQLEAGGSVGPDLAPEAAAHTDDVCMKNYMPPIGSEQEAIQQATNSLAITLCRRADPLCRPSKRNTFIMTVFQHNTFYEHHAMSEPYVMLFDQSPPFAVYAISTKPLWINGRSRFTQDSGSVFWQGRDDLPENHSELFYVTGISWKTHGQRYHGYMDDLLFLTFGIEDSRPGIIDVPASDLLQDLGFCADVI